MIRGHKIRLNPTPEQETYFRKASGVARFVYNWGLAQWKAHKAEHPGKPYGTRALRNAFNQIKGTAFPFVSEVAKDVAENAFADLGVALKNYFESKNGKRKGSQMGFPQFKAKKKSKRKFCLNNDKIAVDTHAVRIPRLGWVNMAENLRWDGYILRAVVSEDAGKWYISFNVEVPAPEPVQFQYASIGIDLGIKTLATLSDGTEFENQKLLKSELRRLQCLSRRLSRRQEGSKRWWRAKEALACCHARIRHRRADILHKMTTQIARTYALVGLEDLHVKGMQRNRRLALSIADASLSEVGQHLAYKCRQFGGRLQKVGRFFASSQRCAVCGSQHTTLTLTERTWRCEGCGAIHRRDFNAAVNIAQEALRLAFA